MFGICFLPYSQRQYGRREEREREKGRERHRQTDMVRTAPDATRRRGSTRFDDGFDLRESEYNYRAHYARAARPCIEESSYADRLGWALVNASRTAMPLRRVRASNSRNKRPNVEGLCARAKKMWNVPRDENEREARTRRIDRINEKGAFSMSSPSLRCYRSNGSATRFELRLLSRYSTDIYKAPLKRRPFVVDCALCASRNP